MTNTSSAPEAVETAMEATILALAGRPGAPRTIAPEEPARALATGPDWQSLLPLVRQTALRLAREGRLVLYRKGKPVDPDALKGVYRLGLPLEDQGAGNQESVRPVQ